ncbi:MAG: DUF1850 domain-containing protein [Synergistaceae bacterium]|jgi:hypothetical protein|nr:DUF1850 domain-containing protein [Synergistaceae bacterium]
MFSIFMYVTFLLHRGTEVFFVLQNIIGSRVRPHTFEIFLHIPLMISYMKKQGAIELKHADGSGILKIALKMILAFVCALILYPSLPVNYFVVSHHDKVILAAPLPNAYSFVTAYIHSLQLTPVIDDYRFVNGRIWGWEEWTQSHNAGLPSVSSPHSKLIMRSPWMIYRGGRTSAKTINYRVGNAKFGRNIWRLDPWGIINIFEIYPKFRMTFQASTVPFKDAPVELLKAMGLKTTVIRPEPRKGFASVQTHRPAVFGDTSGARRHPGAAEGGGETMPEIRLLINSVLNCSGYYQMLGMNPSGTSILTVSPVCLMT